MSTNCQCINEQKYINVTYLLYIINGRFHYSLSKEVMKWMQWILAGF